MPNPKSPRSPIRRSKELLSELRSRLRNDPVFFARSVLGIEPWGMQAEILEEVKRCVRVAVAGGQGVGKGHVAATAMLHFLYTRPGSIVLSTAPTARQVRKLLWGEVRRLWTRARIRLGGRLGVTSLDLAPGWYAYGFSTDESDRFQGFHAPSMFVVIDEAAGVSREIFEAADAVLTGEEAHLLLIGNPTSKAGRFYEAFSDPSFTCLRIPCTAHPNVTGGRIVIPGAVTRGWIDLVRESYGESSAYYQARVLAQFPREDADSLVPGEWIERAFAAREGAAGVRSLGADIARFGNDSTAIVVAEGGTVRGIRSLRRRDLVACAETIEEEARAHGVPPEYIHVDDTGLGGGVTDMLRARGLAVQGVRFGARARQHSRFVNRKAEMFWHLRRVFEAGAAALEANARTRDGEILKEQLGLLRSDYAEDGRIKVTGEPGPLAAPSTSPDHADALALAFLPLEVPCPGDRPPATDAEAVQRRAGIWVGHGLEKGSAR